MKKIKLLLCLVCALSLSGCSQQSNEDEKEGSKNTIKESSEIFEKTGNEYFSKQYKDKYINLSKDYYFTDSDGGEAYILPLPQYFVKGELNSYGHSMIQFQTDEGKYVSLSATLRFDSTIKDNSTHKENPINKYFGDFDNYIDEKDCLSNFNQETLQVKTTKLNNNTIEADVVTLEYNQAYSKDTLHKNIVSYWMTLGTFDDEKIGLELEITASLLTHDELKDIADYFINNLEKKSVDRKNVEFPSEINDRTEDITLDHKENFIKEYYAFKDSALKIDIPSNAEVLKTYNDKLTFKVSDKDNHIIGTGIFEEFTEFMSLSVFNDVEQILLYDDYEAVNASGEVDNAYPLEKITLSNENLKSVTINGQKAMINYGEALKDNEKIGEFSIISIWYDDNGNNSTYTLVSASDKVSAKKLYEFQLGILDGGLINAD